MPFLSNNMLRLCAGCNRNFLTYASHNPEDPFFCPKCWKVRTENFDPQPNDQVRDIDHMSGPFSSLFVVARDGDQVTVQPIGFPDRRRTVALGQLMRPF